MLKLHTIFDSLRDLFCSGSRRCIPSPRPRLSAAEPVDWWRPRSRSTCPGGRFAGVSDGVVFAVVDLGQSRTPLLACLQMAGIVSLRSRGLSLSSWANRGWASHNVDSDDRVLREGVM